MKSMGANGRKGAIGWYEYAVGFCAILVVFSILMPVFARADSYDGPYCDEPKSITSSDTPDPTGIRGTCKDIKIQDIVSLDPLLQNDYFIGTHGAMEIGPCDRECSGNTKYSEQLTIYSSSTVFLDETQPDYIPTEVAVFSKSFFLPLFLDQFQKEGLSFNGNNFPPININIYNPTELNEVSIYPPNATMDVLINASSEGYEGGYYIDTLNYQKYGEYIWGPQTNVVESQYAGLYKNDKASTASDLGISYVSEHYANVPTVSVADPLQSVTNYWVYTVKDSEPALVWQKTDYGFNDGSVKTVASADAGTSAATSSASSSVVTSTTSPTSSTPTGQTPAPENIFQKIWDFIAS